MRKSSPWKRADGAFATTKRMTRSPLLGNEARARTTPSAARSAASAKKLDSADDTVGAEMDTVVELGSKRIGFEVKFSSAPKVTKGFWQARQDLALTATYVVAPVQEGWSMDEGVSVISVADVPARLALL